jgi:hypothetical protein
MNIIVASNLKPKKMNRVIYTFLLVFLSLNTFAQSNITVKGKVVDSKEKLAMPGATVVLSSVKDSLDRKGTITNEHGEFVLKAKEGDYKLNISFIGYKDIKKDIAVREKPTDVGTLSLSENAEILNEITVIETLPPTKQKGDTTVFNPDAFKVNPDATAEELLAKMPGFYSVDGKFMAQGQEVEEVLIDGKKFFGKNVSKALETIPNDVIQNIEVYKYESDEAKFSGFKDKEKKKTINIVTNNKKKSMLFGRVAAGVGKDDKYAFNGVVNQFSDKTRITVSAKSKNVNAPLRLNVKNAVARSINGNDIQQDNLGFNFNATGKKGNELAATYYYGNNENENESQSKRTYTSDPLIGQTVDTDNKSDSDRDSHNLNLYYQIKSNPKNMVFLNTTASLSDNTSESKSEAITSKGDELINTNTNNNLNNSDSKNLNQSINFMRSLNDKGRSISFNGSFGYNENNSDGKQQSITKDGNDLVTQNIDRISNQESKAHNISAGVSYTDMIGENGHLSIGYTLGLNENKSDKTGYNFNEEDSKYSLLDTLTTNNFKNTSTNHTGRFSYTFQKEKYGLTVGTDVQFTKLDNEETFPKTLNTKKDYFAMLPSVNFNYNLSDSKYFNVYYRMGATNPTAKQLQEVVDVSNPLYISTGNSDLKQSFSHSVMAFYTASNMKKGTFTSIHINATKTNNTVANKTFVATQDTTIDGKYNLPQGGQFSQPVNLDGQYSLSARATYGLPINKIKSKLNITSGATYSHTPTIVNEKKAFSNSLNLNQGFNLSSNISHRLDFTISSQTNYSKSKSSGSSYSGSEFISQTSSASIYWNFYKNFNIKTNASNVYKNNYSTNESENNWLLDIGISTRVFKSKRGEISLVAYDVLNSNNSRNHSVSELYTVDTYTKKLNNFYMLSFTYKIRNGKGGGRGRHGAGMYPGMRRGIMTGSPYNMM